MLLTSPFVMRSTSSKSTLKFVPVMESCMYAGLYPFPSVHCVDPLNPARGVRSSLFVTHTSACRCRDDPESRTLQLVAPIFCVASRDKYQSLVSGSSAIIISAISFGSSASIAADMAKLAA